VPVAGGRVASGFYHHGHPDEVRFLVRGTRYIAYLERNRVRRHEVRAGYAAWQAGGVKVVIRVQPGAKHATVGGTFGGALIVRVRERAVEGRATKAALAAIAKALDVPVRDVTLVSGATSRTKIVDVPDSATAQLATLRGE